jgi:molybdopterin-guanine dinucleotide biosynthesis protein A
MSVLGLVLAGGLASRLGGDKALRELKGHTLLTRAIEALKPLCDVLAVSTGSRNIPLPPDVLTVPDLEPYMMQGPLSGLYAGLKAAQAAGAESALALACDLPHVSTALLARLHQDLMGHDVVFCEHGGLPEPLVCALRTAPMLAAVENSLAAGSLRVVPLWKRCRCRLLTDADLAAFAPLERTFANINTPEDLAREQ